MAGLRMRVQVAGLRELEQAAKRVDPLLVKALDRAIRGELAPIVSKARGLVPQPALSRWRPGAGASAWSNRLAWDSARVRSRIATRRGRGRGRGGGRVAYRIVSQEPAGAVYEFAASGVFGRNLSRHGRPGRLIWQAWDQHGGSRVVERSVEGHVRRAENDLERLLNGSG